MAEVDRTNQEIDNAIRAWKLRLKDIPEALGVSRDRVQERWEWFRQEVYRRIADGKSTPDIVAEVGLPTSAVAAFRARWTQGYRPDGIEPAELGSGAEEHLDNADVENAVVTTFGLERDLQRTLRENIAQLEPGLRIIDGGREHRSAAGLIDILCEASDGALVVVELKAGLAKDAALGQVLGYMGATKHEMTGEGEYAGRPVRGILIAKDFDDRVRHASLAVPSLRLMSYQIRFSFENRGLPASTSAGAPEVD